MSSAQVRARSVSLWILPFLILLGACSSWQVQSVTPSALVTDSHPSSVRVRRQDGARIVVRQPAVRGDSVVSQVVGDSSGIPLGDISDIELHRFDLAKTAGLVALVAAVPVVACFAACEFGWTFSPSSFNSISW